MDLSYLLWLQNLRQASAVLEKLFAGISAFAVNPATMLIVFLIYWCLDRVQGIEILSCFTFGQYVNNTIKLTACVYRPWIRSSAIVPSALAVDGATGYSFPSGHTQMAASTYGVIGKQEKKHKMIRWICWIFAALVAFSRNFLGVHTPQDVLAALLEAVVLWNLLQWFERKYVQDPSRGRRWILLASLLCFATVLYYLFKSYPMDYENGMLVVDPEEMQIDGFGSVGMFLGFTLGWRMERKYVRFENCTGVMQAVIRILCGILAVGAVTLAVHELKPLFDPRWYKLTEHFLQIFAGMFLTPLLFHAVENSKK